MMYINSFITELSKKIETVDNQLKDFESKMDEINEVISILTLKTLKDIDSLKGEDLVLLSKEDFAKILTVFKFDDIEEKIKIFFNACVEIKVNQKLVSDGEIEVLDNSKINDYIEWLNEQIKYIKEYINDFNDNNKEYYNSLKISDALYKKYLSYFKNEKLIKPIYNIEEFNEVIKKTGIITSEKWELLKYVGEANISFYKKDESNNKETIEYNDDEIINFAETILLREKNLLDNINEKTVDEALELFEKEDEEVKKLNLKEEDIVKYQKIPVVYELNNIYQETKEMLKQDKDKDAFKIEKNLKDILELVDSYNVIKKIES